MQLQIGIDLSNLSLLPLVEPSIRIEERHEPDRYAVRAEIPGVDPKRDVEVSIRDGALHLVVVRLDDQYEHGRTEFHYGTFHRSLALPPGARPESLKTSHANGILEVTVSLAVPANAL